ncbi:hypothetical protein Pcinc_012168 [Petrolisthes cinctipes]|uniref:Uncharacterized protein n=1 Tax=Petrolisthes cinctipes TaxID=88211 RepID=A0AAE1G5D4_PETCI|nr:hypothetical protein Pcinc_012168 [Petrolisthes cinctipes]
MFVKPRVFQLLVVVLVALALPSVSPHQESSQLNATGNNNLLVPPTTPQQHNDGEKVDEITNKPVYQRLLLHTHPEDPQDTLDDIYYDDEDKETETPTTTNDDDDTETPEATTTTTLYKENTPAQTNPDQPSSPKTTNTDQHHEEEEEEETTTLNRRKRGFFRRIRRGIRRLGSRVRDVARRIPKPHIPLLKPVYIG